jgi:tetrahydromethanopterin S-methyltransferase subunit F
MDVHMILAKLRHQNMRDIARGFAVGFVCSLVLMGLLAKIYCVG